MEGMMYIDRTVEEIKLTSALKKRTVYIDNVIDESTAIKVNYLLDKIVELDEKEGKKDKIIIKILSYGGNVLDGLSICSKLLELKEDKDYIIETQICGYAMSMAFVIALLGSKGYRKAQRLSRLMCHQISQFKYGQEKFQDMLENVEEMKALNDKLFSIIMENSKMTKEMADDIIKCKTDKYYWTDESLKLEFIDKII